MKRYGNLVPIICTRENIERSIKTVLRGNDRKHTRTARNILKHKEEVIDWVIKVISDGSFRLGNYESVTIKEGPKERDIQIITYKDRIVVNAIMTILDELLLRRLIYTTASSIKGRGAVYLKDIVQRDIRNHPEETRYVYKIDIHKYYHSIDHDLMKVCIRRYIKDKTLLPILDNFIDMLPEGLSISLRASQVFGNLFLGWLVDMPLKCRHRVKFFYRYCDDIVILGPSKEYLWGIHNIIVELLENTKLQIKPNYRVYPLSEGIDFLGYVIFSGIHCRVRKRIKNNAQRKLHKLRSSRRRQEIIASIKGYCVHSNGHNLFNNLVKIYGTKSSWW